MFNDEYIDFKFGSYWASDFNLIAVSSSDRYSPPMHGTINANTVSLTGRRGAYKFKTQINEKNFIIKIAYDNVPIEWMPKIKRWLDPEKIQKLIFNDEPYKYYWACLNTDPEFTFLPFLEGKTEVGNMIYQNGVIKGEATLSFTCIDNFAYSAWENFANKNLAYVETGSSEVLVDESNIKYTNFITDIDLQRNLNDKDLAQLYIDNPTNFVFQSVVQYDIQDFDFANPNPEEEFPYMLSDAIQTNAGAGDGIREAYKPWVRMSNLLDYNEMSPDFYVNKGIISYPLIKTDNLLGGTIYRVLNCGNTHANLNVNFDMPAMTVNNPITIKIYDDSLKTDDLSTFRTLSWNNSMTLISEFQLNYFGNYKPYRDFVEAHPITSNYYINIDSDLCEVFLVDKLSGDKLNLNRFNEKQSFLTLQDCNFIDYTKPFPTFNVDEKVRNTSLRKTKFNRIVFGNNYTLQDVELSWKHTYL